MNDFCINHPDRRCAVKIHDVTSGEHVETALCFDCACAAGDQTALMMKAQSQTMDFMMEALNPTALASKRIH